MSASCVPGPALPEAGWGRVLKHTSGLPERLDNEMSFLSLTDVVEAHRILKPDPRLPDLLDYNLTFFSDRPFGLTSSSSWLPVPNDVSFRFEFPLSGAFGERERLPRTTLLARHFETLIAPLGIGEHAIITCSVPTFAEPDPGDLSGVWVIDGTVDPASCAQLCRASSHLLMGLAADPGVQLLRLP